MRSRTLRDTIRWLTGRLRRWRIAGASMHPTLADGQTVLVDTRAYDRAMPAVGDVVLAEHPRQPGIPVVKRVARLDGARVVLSSDNLDARANGPEFGIVDRQQVTGRVECTFP